MTNPYQLVRERDYHACRLCSRVSSQLEVHHIVFRSQGGGEEPENLITLCKDHHLDAHGTRRPGSVIPAWLFQFMLDWHVFGMAAAQRLLIAQPTCRTCEYRRGDWTCAVWDNQECHPRYGCNAWKLTT